MDPQPGHAGPTSVDIEIDLHMTGNIDLSQSGPSSVGGSLSSGVYLPDLELDGYMDLLAEISTGVDASETSYARSSGGSS